MLADELRDSDPSSSERFLNTARLNLQEYWFGALWHEPTKTLWDSSDTPSFVPNKAATFIEAVMLLGDLDNDRAMLDHYAIPTADKILEMQVTIRSRYSMEPSPRIDSDRTLSGHISPSMSRGVFRVWQNFQRSRAIRAIAMPRCTRRAFSSAFANRTGASPKYSMKMGPETECPNGLRGVVTSFAH